MPSPEAPPRGRAGYSPRSEYVALTIHQPWAYLVATGQKMMELRPWPHVHRGPTIIHAGLKVDVNALTYFGLQDVDLPRQAALGVVDLVDVRLVRRAEMADLRLHHRVWGPYRDGSLGFIFSSPALFSEPIPMKGKLNFFSVVDEAAVRAIAANLLNWPDIAARNASRLGGFL